jgi:hypothetical protein
VPPVISARLPSSMLMAIILADWPDG